MRLLVVGVVLVAAGLAAVDCSRSELFDTVLLLPPDGGLPLDGSQLQDASPDAADASMDAESVDASLAILECPHAPVDVCGVNMYQPGAPWPTYQRCSTHTGRTDAIGPTKPVIRWAKFPLEALIGPPAVGADGTIFFTRIGELDALNPDGTFKFQVRLSVLDTGISPVAIGPDGTIFATLDRVYATNPDGTLKWGTFPIVGSAPTVFGTVAFSGPSVALGPCGALFVGGPAGTVLFNQDGNEAWRHPGQGLIPAVDTAGGSYFGNVAGDLIKLRGNGSAGWTFPKAPSGAAGPQWLQAAPVIGPDGTLYYSNKTALYAVDDKGVEKWEIPWNAGVTGGSSAALALDIDGTIYATTPDQNLSAITPAGKMKWSINIGVSGTAPVIDGNGTVFALGNNALLAVTPAGKIAWTVAVTPAPLGGALAFGADGTLYVSAAGLYAITNGK